MFLGTVSAGGSTTRRTPTMSNWSWVRDCGAWASPVACEDSTSAESVITVRMLLRMTAAQYLTRTVNDAISTPALDSSVIVTLYGVDAGGTVAGKKRENVTVADFRLCVSGVREND